MPGHNILYVGRNRSFAAYGSAFTSPFLLEILSTRTGAPSFVSATGSLTANTGQTVSCSRASSAYCLGDDGLLHLLGANTVRVEPTGLLVEGAGSNNALSSCAIGDGNWNTLGTRPTVTLNSTDVLDPAGGHEASKLVYVGGIQEGVYSTNFTTCQSVYLRTLTGTATIYIADAGGTNPVTTCNLTTTWQRFTNTPSNGNLVIGFGGGITPIGGACTVYAWGAQGENMPFATSFVRTTGAPATRDADVVSVTNPLAALGQPVNTWRVGAALNPLSTWANIYAANASVIVEWAAFDGGGGANTSEIFRQEDATRLTFNVFDATGTALSVNNTSVFSGSTPVTVLSRDTAGTLAITPGTPSAPVGTGTGVIGTMLSTLNIGGRAGGVFPAWGHMTDIVVNNT